MTTTVKWRRVSKAFPCRVCQRIDWCTVSEIGSACCRIESGHPLKNGSWLHRDGTTERKLRPLPPPPPTAPAIDATKLLAKFAEDTTMKMREALADELGVDCGTLVALGAAWAAPYQAWAWPMCDGAGNCIGVRLRSNSRKWAVTGSRAGLFIPQKIKPQKRIVITEGPTDTAAALTLGFFAIGRPSCTGGVGFLQTALRRLKVREAVIISDSDTPGLRGAQLLADDLPVPSCIYCPPAKDIRAALQLGLTPEMIESAIKSTVWHQPKP